MFVRVAAGRVTHLRKGLSIENGVSCLGTRRLSLPSSTVNFESRPGEDEPVSTSRISS